MSKYSTGDVAKRFNVKTKTVRDWADKYFTDFLSTGASPGSGKNKTFTDSDLEVFAVWEHYRTEGKTVDDVCASLRNGERMTPPDEPATEAEKRLVISQIMLKNTELQQENERLHQELEAANEKMSALVNETIRTKAQSDIWKSQYESLQSRIDDLMGELAVLKHQLAQENQDG